MFRHEADRRPLWAWVLCAMTAPVARLAGKLSWVSLLSIAAVAAALSWCNLKLSKDGRSRRWYCVVQFIWLAVYTGQMALWSKESWPDGGNTLVIPLTLLALAAASAWNGAKYASATGGIVFWLLALLYVGISAAGLRNVEIGHLAPTWRLDAPEAAAVLLVPVTVSFLPRQRKGEGNALLILVLFAVLLALLTTGTLSEQVAARLEHPFYEFGKSLSLFGVAERLESFVSVALTMGYFAQLSLLLTAAGHLANDFRLGWGRTGVAVVTAITAAVVLAEARLEGVWIASGAALLWGVLPIIHSLFYHGKRPKKDENNA